MHRVTLYLSLFIHAKYNDLMENYKLKMNKCKDASGPVKLLENQENHGGFMSFQKGLLLFRPLIF
jgi:hypothetical protein